MSIKSVIYCQNSNPFRIGRQAGSALALHGHLRQTATNLEAKVPRTAERH